MLNKHLNTLTCICKKTLQQYDDNCCDDDSTALPTPGFVGRDDGDSRVVGGPIVTESTYFYRVHLLFTIPLGSICGTD